MKSSIQTLSEILYPPCQYAIPVFQRNYRWEMPQWEKLWDSLIEIQSPDKRGKHFMGFLVFVSGLPQPGRQTTFHLIDGQQRLTTSSILLIAVRNIARGSGQTELAEEIDQSCLVHPLKRGNQRFRLLPKESDFVSYAEIVSGQGEASGRMADALRYFMDRVTTHTINTPDKLRNLFYSICQKLEFMCATLEAENPYNIFKSLNSTGVPLGSSDLIRNFVFMHVVVDEQDDFDRDLWRPLENNFLQDDGVLDEEGFSRFFRDFLMADGRYVAPKDTFASFEARYEATGFSPNELALSLIDGVARYMIISGQQADECDEVTQALAGLNLLDSSTTYSLLLALFGLRANGIIQSEQLAQCIQMLRGFILRRFVCAESSRGYGQMFVRALAKDAGDPVKTLEAYLLDRGWPDDRQFEEAFVEFPLYDRGYKREVLVTLEQARGHKEPADLTAAQVEHVMPQTLNDGWIEMLGSQADRVHADWLHRPGNLTLSAYNQELWNHPFPIKRERYAQSNIVLTRELSESDRWDEDKIRERGHQLARDAMRIWIGPKEQVTRTEQAGEVDEESPGRRELRMRFWRGLNDYLAVEHPELPDFEARPSKTIRLPSGIRYVGLDLWFGLRDQQVGIDIWFWREESFPVWERVRAAPAQFNEALGAEWEIDRMEGHGRGWMSTYRGCGDLRQEANWSAAYRWFGQTLTTIFEKVAPKLRVEMDRRGTV